MLRLALLILATACIANAAQFPIRASALLAGGMMSSDPQQPLMIFGDVKFTQTSSSSPVQISLNVTFFPPTDPLANQMRGVHVHTFSMSEIGQDPSVACDTAGPHWNPTEKVHGPALGANSHAGDLGNIQPVGGRVVTQLTSNFLTLDGPDSILGRSVVIHEKPDDEGRGRNDMSLKNGNAGKRVACGTIGIIKA